MKPSLSCKYQTRCFGVENATAYYVMVLILLKMFYSADPKCLNVTRFDKKFPIYDVNQSIVEVHTISHIFNQAVRSSIQYLLLITALKISIVQAKMVHWKQDLTKNLSSQVVTQTGTYFYRFHPSRKYQTRVEILGYDKSPVFIITAHKKFYSTWLKHHQ